MDTQSSEQNRYFITDLQLLRCPISMTLCYDPVIAEDGYTYDRHYINTHFKIKQTSPMTNELIGKSLTPNLIIKQIIQNVLKNNSNLQKEFDDIQKDYYLRLGKDLYNACEYGNIKEVQLLIDKGAKVDLANKHGWTPLFIACIICPINVINVVQLLIDNGAEINQVDKNGHTPLMMACNRGNVELSRLLLNNCAEVNNVINVNPPLCRCTPLMCACAQGNIHLVKLLLENGADVNRVVDILENGEIKDTTPLLCACSYGYFNIVQLLLDNGACIDFNNYNTNNIEKLFIACYIGRIDYVRLLLKKGTKLLQNKKKIVNHVINDSMTPLYVVCKKGYLDIARLLIDNGADIKLLTDSISFMSTPMWIACSKNHVDIAKLLIKKDRSVIYHEPDVIGLTPLLIASQHGNLLMTQLLLENHENVNQSNNKEWTPLYMACSNNHYDVAKMLLEHDADINHMNSNLETPLWVACRDEYLGIVQLLLDHNASVNQADIEGWTPLHVACANGYIHVVKMLLDKMDKHASYIKDKDGHTPLDLTLYEYRNLEIHQILLDHAATS